jgi:hypothetical protein
VKKSIILKSQNSITASGGSDDDVDNNTAWVNIQKNIRISAKETLGCYKLKQQNSGSKEISQIAKITGSEPNKCR